MRSSNVKLLFVTGGIVATLTACGFEQHIVDILTDEPVVVTPVPPVGLYVTIDGISSVPTIYVYTLDGTEVLATQVEAQSTGEYVIEVPSEVSGQTLRLVAVSGSRVLKSMLFCFTPPVDRSTTLAVTLDAASTAATLAVEAMGNWRGDSLTTYVLNGYGLASYGTDELELGFDAVLDGATAGSGAASDFYAQVVTLIGAAPESGTTPVFAPAVSSTEILSAAFLGETPVDFDDDGDEDTDPAPFNEAAIALADTLRQEAIAAIPPSQFTDTGGTSYDLLTVIFTAHTATGVENGNCQPIDICNGKTIVCDDGDSLFFTGGLHETSPIQDPSIQQLLGDFKPNRLPMYDDGTHGDEIASDSVWTIVFQLPVGLRMGYKYTWGQAGQNWTGTEEWPGNQRILEIVDINEDGYVWRDDNVTDEATNKDKSNCYGVSCSQSLSWDEDLNGDGYLEAREHPLSLTVLDEATGLVQLAGKCTFDDYVRPTRTARATNGSCAHE